jgi:hypothetical protein
MLAARCLVGAKQMTTINIDKLMNTAEQGVRRASVFMGFGNQRGI